MTSVFHPKTVWKNAAAAGTSGVYSSDQISAPFSMIIPRPGLVPGCQTPKYAPRLSVKPPMRP